MMDKINRLMEEIKVEEQKALQSQIGPHFIYNALNTIKYLAKLQNITNIDEISGALVELLRSVLGNVRETVTIREELEYVKGYVLIQKYKFLDRVKVFFDVEEEVLESRILKLILQPVVENAMLHGIASSKEGTVLVKIYREDNRILFEVTDNGVGMTTEQINKAMNMEGQKDSSRFSSMGLKNVGQRIKLAYGEAYGLQIYSCPGVFTTVEMSVPVIGEGTRADAS
ncbi:Sensor histidine kinase YpdA [compost metagenome]